MRGAALPLALLLLVAVSGLAVVAAAEGVLQLRMAENSTTAVVPRTVAQSALDWAEAWLLGQPGDARPGVCSTACGAGEAIYAVGALGPVPEQQAESWWLAMGSADGSDPLAASPPVPRPGAGLTPGHWLVEELRFEPATADGAPARSYYRILARGTDPGARQPAVLESILVRPWGEADWRNALPPEPADPDFCSATPPGNPCGRLAWQQRR